MQKEIDTIKNDIEDIKTNHLFHIEKDIKGIHGEIQDIQIGMTEMSINQKWVMKFFWIIAAASIGGLLTGIFNAFTSVS
tara:strand:+ start:44 stop:280 length:237 start_codon:yes stop_codon:yes gene_type:complete